MRSRPLDRSMQRVFFLQPLEALVTDEARGQSPDPGRSCVDGIGFEALVGPRRSQALLQRDLIEPELVGALEACLR